MLRGPLRGGKTFVVGAATGHRQQHADQRDAVGDTVVDANDQRGAALVVLHHVHLPQRPPGIERLRRQLRYQRLQLRLAAGTGQRDAQQMAVEVDLDFFPPGAAGLDDGAATEAPERQELVFEDAPHAREVEAGAELDHADDHHQIAGRVHAQPGRVDRRHALAARARC
jgi:hypothetical protein